VSAAMPTWWRGSAGGLSEEECREAVQDALDSLPPEIASKLDNVAVIVEDRDPSERLLGLFDPRGGLQRIIIYRQLHSSTDQVKRTVLHEVGHYFGMNEQQIRELGYG
jgi:predicted Zn-dependent protease with MMP-like domain